MRLQVEIATASWTSSCAVSVAQKPLGLVLVEREALAHRDRRGLVRDAEREQLAHRCAASSGSAPASAPGRSSRRSSASSLSSVSSRSKRASFEAMITT